MVDRAHRLDIQMFFYCHNNNNNDDDDDDDDNTIFLTWSSALNYSIETGLNSVHYIRL